VKHNESFSRVTGGEALRRAVGSGIDTGAGLKAGRAMMGSCLPAREEEEESLGSHPCLEEV